MTPARSTGACPACGRPVFGGAKWCKARLCSHYAPIWAKDQQRKVFENCNAYSAGDGHAIMLTITAPGARVLPWDDRCAGLGPHKHSGLLGCRVDREAAKAWNATAPDRWRRLHDRCARLTARRTGSRPNMLVRAWETQTRGVLHVHAVIARGHGCDKLASDLYADELRRLSPTYGFGTVDKPTGRARLARESAAYISSYLTKGSGSKRTLCETVRSDELPRSIIHVSTVLTQQTCVTMRSLRFRRLVNRRWQCNLPFTEQRQIELLCAAFDAELEPIHAERGPPERRVT